MISGVGVEVASGVVSRGMLRSDRLVWSRRAKREWPAGGPGGIGGCLLRGQQDTRATAISKRTSSNDQMTTEMDDAPSSFWVRAMYDYESTDDSSLTFSRGDIVEVLTQLESGWWDGLIDTERGWFPSNFVTIISDEEAEAELALRRAANAPAAVVEVDPAQLDASGSDSEWLQDELEQAAGIDIALPGIDLNFPPAEPVRRAADSAQLWLPEVQPNGQVCSVCLTLFNLLLALTSHRLCM